MASNKNIIVGRVRIADRIVGDGKPCFIIAEVGCNHNGRLQQAKELIGMAAEAGCDAVKFQSFTTEKLFNKHYQGYRKGWIELLKSLEVPRQWHKLLYDYCKRKDIIFLSSICDEEKVDWLDELGVSAFKVPSYELTHIPLLRYAAKKKRPIILSTGIANEKEIQESIQAIREEGNDQIAIMHCISTYPGRIDDLNLQTIPYYKKRFQVPVGLSDHCLWIYSSVIGVGLGANIVEKHITIDRTLPGPDHHFALNKTELNEWVKQIRNSERALGRIKTHPPDAEKKELLWRRATYAKKDIPAKKTITEEDIMIVRPSPRGSLPPRQLYNIIGKKTQRTIKAGESITFKKLSR